MSPDTWLACDDPLEMLRFLGGRASNRKYRLFAAACARDEFAHGTVHAEERPPEFLPRYLAAIESAEAYADGGPAPSRSFPPHWAAYPVGHDITDESVALGALGYDADTGQ